MGGSFTKVTDLELSHRIVPEFTLGFDTGSDPANGLFTAANFPGSTSTDLTNARNLYALLTGRVTPGHRQCGAAARRHAMSTAATRSK